MNIYLSAHVLLHVVTSLTVATVITAILFFSLVSPPLSAFNAFVFLSFALIFFVIKSQRSYRGRSGKFGRLPPGPTPWPVVGCLPQMVFMNPRFHGMHRFMREMGTDNACVRIGSSHMIPVTCPRIATKFLKKQLARLTPGPTSWPVLGNHREMISNKPVFRWIHHLMEEMNTEIACVRIGSTHVVSVTCPKIATEILKKQDSVFASRPESMAARTFSKGYKTAVLVPHGDQWKKMRRVLTSEIICPARHNWLHDKRVEEADNLVRYVFAQCGASRGVNIRTAARHYSGNVIRKLMFGKRYFGKGLPDGGPGVEEEEHVEALFTALGYLYAFCVSDYFPCLEGLDLDGHEKIVKEAAMTMEQYHGPIVDQRILQWRRLGDNNKQEPQDLLDVLITLKDSNGQPLLTSGEIKAQTTEIMMAAVDNPSNVAEWAMAEMICQPELLQKAVEELDRVVGKDRLVQESDISQLNYIKACAREVFRLHPIAPFNVPHVAMSDTTVAGYFIPKGSHVLVSRLGLGRNPNVWDDPLKYKPERHLGDGCTNVVLTEPDLRFISFSTGRRGCIAASLGTAMTVMLLARLIQGFSWEKSPEALEIDLAESEHDLFLSKPLTVRAEPRLPLHLYLSI